MGLRSGLALFLLTLITSGIKSQTVQATIFEDWTTSAGNQSFYQKSVTKTDASAIYIAGATLNSTGDYDLLVAKYSKTGVLSWINQYAGSGGGNDFASALWIDASGNVYVTGSVLNAAADSNNVLTIKYNSSGTQQWVSTYNGGTGTDVGSDIVVDGSGNVYVTGTSNQGSTNKFDAVTIKYNSSGSQQWVSLYDYNNLNDAGYKITLDGTKVIVGAGAQNSSTDYRQAVVKYMASSGSQNSATVSSSSGIGFAMVYGIVTDAQKNIYLTGSKTNTGVGLDYYTVKYDSSLVVQWTATYNGSANGNDEAKGIALDGSGNVYVTGYSTETGQNTNFVTIKYNSSGTQQWAQSVNDEYNGHDEGTALALDASGLPVVTGFVWNGVTNDYYTIKYDASGNTLWKVQWNSVKDENDKALDVAVDIDGGVVVVGQTGTGGSLTYTVVKYTQKNAYYMPDGMALSTAWAFTKNRGQVLGTDNLHYDTLKYYCASSYPRTYFSNKTVSYVFASAHDSLPCADSLARIDMGLKGANNDRLIRAFDPRSDVQNYYGQGTPQGAVRVPLYKRLICYDAWTKTDVEYVQNGQGLVTYFVVKPGGNPANIQMLFNGQTGISVNGSGDLVLSTAIGSISMPKATAFQIDNSGNYVSLAWQPTYSLTGSTVSFANLGAYNSSYALVFRIYYGPYTSPATNANGNMWWSTYYGGPNGDDFGMDVCNDTKGNSYVVGYTWDQAFPVFNSATPWHGGSTEGVILKFSDQAELGWATFYGGNDVNAGGGGFDWIRSVVFNKGVSSNHLYITGYTNSVSDTVAFANFPIIPSSNPGNGSYWQNVNYPYMNNFGYDAFIARMDTTNGTISWSTFFGGRDYDEGVCIKTAPNGRVFVVGNTSSQLNDTVSCNSPSNRAFPLCHSFSSAYFDASYNGGNTNCFISLFDTTNTLKWSTYLGGGGTVYDAIYNDDNNSIYMVGSTTGNWVSHYQTGEYHMGTYMNQTSPKGFITRFGNGGAMEWSTAINRVKAIQTVTNISKEVLIVGITNSTDHAVITNQDTSAGYAICGTGYMDSTITGGSDYYIMNFSPQNILRWSTFFGGATEEDAPFAVGIWDERKFLDATADTNGNVFILGATDNWYGPPYFTTLNQPPFFWQSSFAGGDNGSSDLVLFCFRANRTLAWSTYCGGYYGSALDQSTDLGSQISYSTATSKIYFTGFTAAPDYPYTCPATANPYCYAPGSNYNYNFPWDIYLTCLNMQNVNVGIGETPNLHDNGQLGVFPNPAGDDFTLVIPEIGKGKSTILVYNSLGQTVAYQLLEPGINQIVIKTGTWATGVYQVQVVQGLNTLTTKVIVQH